MVYRLPDGGPVRVRTSNSASELPTAAELEEGEIALNAADGVLYYQNQSGVIGPVGFSDAPADDNTYGRKAGEWVDLASAAALQFRQGTNADRLAMSPVPAVGEPIYTTDGKRLFIGDGSTVGGRGLVGDTDSCIVCQPGDDLPTKYAQAKLLTPGGSALSATNRGRLLIFPGTYTMNSDAAGAPLTGYGLYLDAEYVDVIGVGSTPWNPTVRTAGTSDGIWVDADDIVVAGLYAGIIAPSAGGANRYLINCAGGSVYACPRTPQVSSQPAVIGGTLIGCYATAALGGFSAGSINVFNGLLLDCKTDAFLCRQTIFQGTARGCQFGVTATTSSFRALQGRVEYCAFTGLTGASLWSRSADGGGVPAAFGSTCTISNASPAVVTDSSHGLYSGMRIRFSTTGTLPTGLNTTTTYYVKVVDSNTFQVATTINGTSINTSSAGSGTHTIEIPPGVEGGRYSYCTTTDGEFATT